MKSISISDDDLCSTCKFCQYNVGGESSCSQEWPAYDIVGGVNDDGYIRECLEYEEID
jgi:hypothetical protein